MNNDTPEFKREDRFIVIKRKHLQPRQLEALSAYLQSLRIRPVEAVVVESDWPEYETVWKMIEARCSPNNDTPADAITQADIELWRAGNAAALDAAGMVMDAEQCRQGQFDNLPPAKAFQQEIARHRTTSLAAQDGRVDDYSRGDLEAASEYLDLAHHIGGCDVWKGHDCDCGLDRLKHVVSNSVAALASIEVKS